MSEMTTKTVETETIQIEKETVTFCDSCGDPTDDPQMVYTGDPEEIFEMGKANATDKFVTEMRNLTHRKEPLQMVGEREAVMSTPESVRGPLDPNLVWTKTQKAAKNARNAGFIGRSEAYHLCDTCQTGLGETDLALAAATAGDLAEESDSEETESVWKRRNSEIGAGLGAMTMLLGLLLIPISTTFFGIAIILAPAVQVLYYWMMR